jgi:uncharacterized protein YdeI (YjbR/CyaY-like superfamily)
MKPRFFKTPTDFHNWLEKNHDKVSELWVGFHKKASGKPSITYHEALDEALCFGWIDGVRKSLNETSFIQRFTSRKARSVWSVVNTKRAEELKRQGRMKPPGLTAFGARDPNDSAKYSFENRPRQFDEALEKRFKAKPKAWEFFEAQPPGYKRIMTFYVMGAKQEETRIRRLDRLIGESAKHQRIEIMTSASKKTKPKA